MSNKESLIDIENRKLYACSCGKQLNPKRNTIFYNSSTPLELWFYAIFLFSVSKNGVSAKELERQLGVTYKTAWRIANKIRQLMNESKSEKIEKGIVEVDETYVGGLEKHKHKDKKVEHNQGRSTKTKVPIIGLVDRTNKTVTTKVLDNVRENDVNLFISETAKKKVMVFTDEYKGYKKLNQRGWNYNYINHSSKEYGRGDVHTNNIEGFWSIMKRGIKGTYIHISKKHMQNYLNEFTFRYNNKDKVIFKEITERILRD